MWGLIVLAAVAAYLFIGFLTGIFEQAMHPIDDKLVANTGIILTLAIWPAVIIDNIRSRLTRTN